MQVNIVKRSSWPIPRQFLQAWALALTKELEKQTPHRVAEKILTCAFVGEREMVSLNTQFRNKDKLTDILSFEGIEDDEVGELVLCGEILVEQGKGHGLTGSQELGYLVIHGLLHLLGYEHENGGPEAEAMFLLQDQLFETLWPQFFKGTFHV